MKQGRKQQRERRILTMALGILCTVTAVVLGILSIRMLSVNAWQNWKLVSNQGVRMDQDGRLTVMQGAELFLEQYTEGTGESIYTLCTTQKLSTEEQAGIASRGLRYSKDAPIRLERKDGADSCYLYLLQQKGKESRVTEYPVSFLEPMKGVRPDAETDATGLYVADAGGSLAFLGEGSLYYTTDGTEPGLIRDKNGSIQLNGEGFRLEPEQALLMEGNVLKIPSSWNEGEVKTISVLGYREGADLGTLCEIRLRIRPGTAGAGSTGIGSVVEQAAAPGAMPASGTPLKTADKIYLTTSTASAVILYTLDGSEPGYELKPSEGQEYVLELTGSTQQYGLTDSAIQPSSAGIRPGETLMVRARTIQPDLKHGTMLMRDSAAVSFSYPIEEAGTVPAPSILPETKDQQPAEVKPGDKLLLSCGDPEADIYYTVDGTGPAWKSDGTPESNTRLYDPVKAVVVPEGSGRLVITAAAAREGMKDSSPVQFVYQYPAAIAPPFAVPGEGMISIHTEITLGSTAEDARIYYTLDGSEPSAQKGSLYQDPLLITGDTVIRAVVVSGNSVSAPVSFTYQVSPELTAPVPSIPTGSVVAPGTVIRLAAQKGAEILYTTDGSNPKEGEAAISGDRVILTGEPETLVTLSVYAKGEGYSDSPAAVYLYTISKYDHGIKTDPEPGTSVKEGKQILLETDVTGGVIYLETEGSNPGTESSRETEVTVPEQEDGEKEFVFKAMVLPEGGESDGSFGIYSFPYQELLAAPEASIPNGAVLLKAQEITLTAEEGEIYYSLDGTLPDETSDLYIEPLKVSGDTTIRAIAITDDERESEAVSFAYTFAEQTADPLLSHPGGAVKAGTKITMSSATPGAVIYYTTDGQIPDPAQKDNLYVYTEPVMIGEPAVIHAIAVADRMAVSEVTSVIYTIAEGEEEELPKDTGPLYTEEGRLVSRSEYLQSGRRQNSYGDFVLRSAATGVTISAYAEHLPVESEVEVTQIPVSASLNRSIQAGTGNEYKAAVCYEILLTCQDQEVKPEGPVEIGLPIPLEYSNTPISILHVDEDGRTELYETRREQGTAYALAEHFGRFCITAPAVAEEDGRSEMTRWLIPAAALLLLAGGYLLLRSGKKEKEEGSSILD